MTDGNDSASGEKDPVRVSLGDNIRRIRGVRSMTVRDLSTQLAPLGLKLSPSGVSEVENATRKVAVDELLKIAIALNTSVIDLLLPAGGECLTVAKGVDPLGVDELYWWLRGEQPWPEDASQEEFAKAARDLHRTMLWWNEDPAVKAVSLLEPIVRLAHTQDVRVFGGTFGPAARKALDDVNREIGKLITEVETAEQQLKPDERLDGR
ncbi:MAG: helix-turn-helix transcriptional regulator [Actinobacteria bacterium]|nr:helix-turn-helix transcriptional regulator [Actinomycetota bacterium]